MNKGIFTSFMAAGVCLVSLTSCHVSAGNESFEADTITVSLQELETLIPDDKLQSPFEMVVAEDKILIANSKVDTIIDRFSLDGNYIDSFLRRGEGPDEVINLGTMQYAAFNHNLYLNEQPWLPLKVITDLNSAFPSVGKVIKLEYTDSAIVKPVGSKIVLANGSIIAKNNDMEGMLAVFNPDHKFAKLMQPYPPKSEFGEGIPEYGLFNFYQDMMGVSPDGKHFVVAYGHGDILAFGKLEADTVAVDYQIKSAPKGVVVKTSDKGYFSFEFDDNWKQSFGFPTLSNKHAYIPYYGERMDEYFYFGKSPEGFNQHIRVYDFSGIHICTYIIPDFITRFVAVTSDDKELFLLNEDPEAGFRILKLNLN